MVAEIYWTAVDGDDSDLIPGGITRIIKSRVDLRIFFGGREGAYGDQYEGVLRIRFRPGSQTLEGIQSYKRVDEPWERVPFSVVGEFKDDRFTSFAGVWTEDGKSYRVEMFGLPGNAKGVASRAKSSVKRRKVR